MFHSNLRSPATARSGALNPFHLVAAFPLLTFSLFAFAHAQTTVDLADLELEQLMNMRIDTVYGASKHEQRVTQAPSAISIISADDIKRFGHRTLVDVLRSVRGLYVSDDRNYTYLGIRGFHRPNDYNTRVLVMIDGHRINDNVYDSGTIGREGMVDVALIERIEVIRGPSSSIYGSSAFFGVINVITKSGSTAEGMEIGADAASLGTYKSRLTYGTQAPNGTEWLLSASHYASEGHETLYYPEFDQRISDSERAANDGIARDLDGEEALNLFTSLKVQNWTFSAFASTRTKDVPTASFDTIFNDGREWTRDQRRYVDVKYDREINAGLNLQARAFYDRAAYDGGYPYDYASPGDPPDPVVSRDKTVGEWFGTQWQLTQRFGAHLLMIGGEYRESVREYQSMYDDVQPRDYFWSDDRRSDTLGLFAQGEIALTDQLMLNAGLRFDQFSAASVDTTNPRIALIYHPTARSAFKALYGEAFRAPNPYEAYYPAAQQSRPPLKAETVRTYELVYEQYLGVHYRVNVSVYSYAVKGLIAQAATEDDLSYFDNLEQVQARGLELEAESKLDSGALVRASYAVQRAQDGLTHTALSSSPRHMGKLNISVPVYRDIVSAGLELQYHGAVKTLQGTTADDFLLTNLTLLSNQISNHLELSISVHNALDEKYGYPGTEDHLQSVLLENGRTLHAKFTYGF